VPEQRTRIGRRLGPPTKIRSDSTAEALLPVYPVVTRLIARVLARIEEGRRRMREEPDAGYSTETVLVTALLVVLAIAVIAVITVKVTEKANSINLG
jgi:hypothetical protein